MQVSGYFQFYRKMDKIADEIIETRWYDYHRIGYDQRLLELKAGGGIGVGGDRCERNWYLEEERGTVHLVITGEQGMTCKLVKSGKGTWSGQWLRFEQMPIELCPASPPLQADRPDRTNQRLYHFNINGHRLSIYEHSQSRAADIVASELRDNAYMLEDIPFRENDLVLDIGAHVGMVSIYLARRFPFLTIFAFEPSPLNYENCRENLRLNRVKNVTLFHQAITGDGRQVDLYVNPVNTGGASVYSPQKLFKTFAMIPSLTLDQLFREHHIKDCKLLKIDCEGSEYEILYNTGILKQVTYLVGELHSNRMLKEMGYSPGALADYCRRFFPPQHMKLNHAPISD